MITNFNFAFSHIMIAVIAFVLNRSGLLELEPGQPYRTLIYAIYLRRVRTSSKVIACRGRLPASSLPRG
jgi:hypothetical protein